MNIDNFWQKKGKIVYARQNFHHTFSGINYLYMIVLPISLVACLMTMEAWILFRPCLHCLLDQTDYSYKN